MKLQPASLMVNGALALLAALTLFPLAWMLSASFMASGEASQFPPPLLPASPTLAHYRELFGTQGLGRQALNSLFVASAATVLSLAFNLTAGYAFAKLPFRGREALFRTLLAAMVIPGQVAMMPLFLMLKHLGLVNSFGGALVPWLAGVFGIFLVRQYALSIPDDLLDAARLDGAGEWRLFRSVVLPAIAPVLATLGVFTFLSAWNDFMWPLIVLSDDSRYTLPVALANLAGEHVQDVELIMGGAVVTVLPVFVAFLFLQRYYIQGIMAGSVKG